jgi:23S rRNA (guanosine2251-2'-O)-methyltransferase
MGDGTKVKVYGRNPIYEVIRADRRRIYQLFVATGVDERGTLLDILDMAKRDGIPIDRVPRSLLDQESENHQGLVAIVDSYPYVSLVDILDRAAHIDEPPFVVLLDLIQDPQNFGSLLRTAEAVGVHGVVIPKRRGVGVTESVVRASSGACEHLLIARDNLVETIKRLKAAHVWLVGLENDPQGQRLEEVDLSGPVGLVIGSEAKGMRRLVRESCDFLVQLPMRGRVESLNATVAGSIALYAIWKTRGYQGA